jgi:hypothetical protein
MGEQFVVVYLEDSTYLNEHKRAWHESFMRKHIHPDADEVALVWEPRTPSGWKGTLVYKRRTNLDILGLLHKYAGYDKLKLEAAAEIERLRAELAEARGEQLTQQ